MKAFKIYPDFQTQCIVLVLSLVLGGFGSAAGQSISSGESVLSIQDLGGGHYGIAVSLNNTSLVYEQKEPLAVEVVTSNGGSSYYAGAYDNVQNLGADIYSCTGSVSSLNGSVFAFTDVYRKSSMAGTFNVSRTVVVQSVGPGDAGFSSRLAFRRPVPSAMSDYDFFAPSIWYKDNTYVSDHALASDYSDQRYWFREDRMPLPVFMLRQKSNGGTFSVFHKDADGSTFVGEDGLPRIIDGRMKFAAMGMENKDHPLVGMIYPGSEGERTGVWGMAASKRTAWRSHPVTTGFTQAYEMSFTLTEEPDYPSALKNTWQRYYNMEGPALYNVDLDAVYNAQIGILDNYWQSINGTAGVPFRIKLDGTVESHLDYNFNMGFVGQQPGNASLLIREGILSDNSGLRSKGGQMIDFWVNNAIMPNGMPRTWYDPYPQTWRNDYHTHMRVVGDGMSGILAAWNYEKKDGVDKPQWLNACITVANWLSSVQNPDGSFYQQYDFNSGNVVHTSKNNTSNVIPFLVDLYLVTGIREYRLMALAAGDFIYEDSHQNYKYAGGAADNPNITDKESASMALRAFLALYDMEKEGKWMDAALQTAHFYQTWVFAWEVPLPQNDPNMRFPKNRSVTGLSQIATGNNAADTYAAIDAFNFYRMYLYTGDAQLLYFSKLLLRNTKQYMNWDTSNPLPGMAPGFLGEAVNVMIPRGHGVDFFLPWQTYNLLEPMVLLQDAFQTGAYTIAAVEALSEGTIDSRHSVYSDTRGLVTAEQEVITGMAYKIISKQSGKVLDVAGASMDNGANIQQWEWLNTDNQKWVITEVGNYYKLENVNSGQAADVVASSLEDGANITQWPYYGNTNQQWTIENTGEGYFKIINRNSGKAMDVENFSNDNGANISQYQYNGTDNQLWMLTPVNTPGGMIASNGVIVIPGSDKGAVIYPNPAESYISLNLGWEVNGQNPVRLTLYNMQGERILEKEMKRQAPMTLELDTLSSGVYMLEARDKAHFLRRKIIIE